MALAIPNCNDNINVGVKKKLQLIIMMFIQTALQHKPHMVIIGDRAESYQEMYKRDEVYLHKASELAYDRGQVRIDR